MDTSLWIVAGVLAVVFAAAGAMDTFATSATRVRLGWPPGYPDGRIKLVGLAELAAAAGLTLPGLVDIATVLTPIAATGICLLMAGAMIIHYQRRQWRELVLNVVLFTFAAVVAWGRFGPHAF